MTYESNYLAHHGIKGQQWGVRRFQNEDGTLTEEGKQRYYSSLSDKQKKIYEKFRPKDQDLIEKKMSKGESFSKAAKDTADRRRAIQELKTAAVFTAVSTAGYAAYLLATFPVLRKSLKKGMLQTVAKAINTKAVGGTLLKAKKWIDHMKMKKAGAIIIKAKDAWISGDKLGA